VRILLWPIHGGYTDAFVRGAHEYLLAAPGERPGEDGGISGWGWERARAVAVRSLRQFDFDLVVLQRPEEPALVEQLTGRVPGRDVPAVYLEHNTPGPSAFATRHPLGDQREIPIVHVTHFNRLFWDNGEAPTAVVEHGVPDPGPLYTGELPRIAAVVNEPVRRWRATGTDLLPEFTREAPVDVFGIDAGHLTDAFPGHPEICPVESLPPRRLHAQLSRRRVYLHPFRWTSLGLSLLEAMHLGMPVVALATTEAGRAVPADAGAVSTDVDELRRAVRIFLHEPEWAAEVGARARRHALTRHGLPAFLARWDEVLAETVDAARRAGRERRRRSAAEDRPYANTGGNTTTTLSARAGA
jgi:hypothetical protein